MSDDSLFSGMTSKQRLRAEVSYLMLKGAGLAAAVFFGIWILIAVTAWFGRTLLPEDAQLGPDPAPEAFIEMAERARAADAEMMGTAPAAEAEAAPAEGEATDGATAEAAPAEGEAAPAEEAPAASE
jgi:hypothetical protein